jgi:integrase
MKRTRYQFGTVAQKPRKKGPDLWVYRWQEDGRRKSAVIGTLEEFPSRAEALKKAEALQMRANPDRRPLGPVSFGTLVDRYIAEELSAGVRHSTKRSYMSILNRHIRPKLADVPLPAVGPALIQDWLRGMQAAPKYKAHIRSLLHRLYEKAMFWGLLDIERNPMDLVEIRGSSKRRKNPVILTIEQYYALLELLLEPYRTMVIVAQCLGLRVSELLGLKWKDVNFEKLTLSVRRSVVNAEVDEVKTDFSQDELPLDPDFATILRAWKRQCRETAEGWVFPSPVTGQPYHASPIQQDYIRRAGRKLGLGDIGWHTFRHTYRAWLDATGAPLGVQQKLMRHADIRTTMNVYGDALMESKRKANSKVVRMVLRPALKAGKIGKGGAR